MKIRQIIKEYEVPDVVDATDTYAPPSNGYAIRVHGPLGSPGSNQTPAASLWYGLSEVFPRDYPASSFQNIGQQMASPQAKILNTIRREGSAVVKSGIASRDLAETLANKLGNYGPPPPPDETVGKIPMSNIEVVSQNMNEAYDPGLSSKLISAGTKVAEYIFIDKGIRDRKFRTVLELDHNISEEELQSHHLYLLRPPNNMGVARSRELLEWMASKGSELNYDKSNPIDFQITIPGSAAYSFNIVKVLRGTNESLDEGAGPAVDDKGWTQRDWIDAVKRKFPGAKIIQSKMIDGPCQVTLPNGKTLYWAPAAGPAPGMAEGTAGLPDPNNFDSDNDYYDALDAYGKPPASDYEPMGSEDEPNDWFDESREKVGNMDADAFDDALARMKKLAGQGPLKTVYDPARRVYKNVPHAVQPAQQPKK